MKLDLQDIDKTIHVLQQALIVVYEDDVIKPNIRYIHDTFMITYKYNNYNVGLNLSMLELERLNLTLEQFVLNIKNHIKFELTRVIY